MSDTGSILEKDQKTCSYLLDYIKYTQMKDATGLMRFDNDIQAAEIALHLKLNWLSEKDTTEKTRR